MSWKPKFKLLEGWLTDKPSFRTRQEAVAYCIEVAEQHMGIVDFDIIGKRRRVKMKDWNITETIARKVLDTIDAGLSSGVGSPKPGEMCVEAAVCYALGLPHGDDPECVSRAVRSLKIALNDKRWSSNKARAKGLRRLGLAQLGSRGHIDDRDFSRRVVTFAIRTCVPPALRHAASIHKDPSQQKILRDMADKCEREPTEVNSLEARKSAAAAAAYAAADAAAAADCASAADAAYAAAYAAAYDAAADCASAYDAAADAAYAAAAYAAADAVDADRAAYAANCASAAAYAAVYAAAADVAYAADAAAYAADAADCASAAAAAAYAADCASAADADAAYAADRAAKKLARDKSLTDFAEGVVQILIKMKAPGCQWLALTEEPPK